MKARVTVAFDVYGTLIDTSGVVKALQALVGSKADAFSKAWRDKQLEYSFRRGLMRRYENFADCTRRALEFTDASFRTGLRDADKDALLDRYRSLPPFDDVEACLSRLADARFDVYAFSNGTAAAVETLLTTAGVRDRFRGIVSVDDLRTFKPNPDVYAHFLERAGADAPDAWLISGNPFDVIGAVAAGMRSAWVQRSRDAIFDPWELEPTIVVTTLADLYDGITGYIDGRADARR